VGVIVVIKHLDFDLPHKENTAVAAALTFALGLGRCRPFDMELAVAEFFLGADEAGAGHTFHGAILDHPLGGTLVPSSASHLERSVPLKRTMASEGGWPGCSWVLKVPGVREAWAEDDCDRGWPRDDGHQGVTVEGITHVCGPRG